MYFQWVSSASTRNLFLPPRGHELKKPQGRAMSAVCIRRHGEHKIFLQNGHRGDDS